VGVLLVISAILRTLIGIYIVFLWARFIIDWIRVLNPRFTPRRGLSVLFELVYTLTDPPIKMFRRIIPPLRLGAFSLDFGWLLTLISCLLIQGFLP
jgi:YggT family protein